MKMFLEIEYTNDTRIAIPNRMLLKNIDYVIIKGNKHIKPDKDSKKIQNYYRFIIDNKKNITEIMINNKNHCFLKDGKFHSYNDYCFYHPPSGIKVYAIEGRILTNDEVKGFLLGQKINKIKNKIDGNY
jgi:hypothetical protein